LPLLIVCATQNIFFTSLAINLIVTVFIELQG